MMRFTAFIVTLSALLLTACSAENKNQTVENKQEIKRVDITALVEHPALNAVRAGIIDELADQGFVVGKNLVIDFQNAQGNAAVAAQIAKQFTGDHPDVIVAITTPSAQAVAAVTHTIPLVFSAITDPVAAKLVKDWQPSGTNITGISDKIAMEPQIEVMKKIVPHLKTVGYVYSPSEVNSQVLLDELSTALQAQNITLVSAAAPRTADIMPAAKSLAGQVDLIFTGRDNNVVSAYESLYQAAKEMKIPLVASDTDSVKRGAVAAFGNNHHDIGRETGKMVVQILKGTAAGDIAPQTTQSRLELVVSPKHAQEQGITLSDELIKEAIEIVE